MPWRPRQKRVAGPSLESTTIRRSWMNFQRMTAGMLSLAVALTLGACGAAVGNGPEGIAPQDWDDEDLPQWVRDLPEGTEPRDDEATQEALLMLLQGHGREGEEAREAYGMALDAAERAIEADPENPQGYYLAGEAHLLMGNLEEAARRFDQAEEIYPRYMLETELLREEAWIEEYNEGIQHLQEGDLDQALPYFERAHTIYQGRPDAMLQLASIYGQLDRIDDAIDLYGQAIDLIQGPRGVDLDEELEPVWEESLEIAMFNRAQLLFQSERYLEAAEAYEAILEEDPEDLMALSNLAISLAAAGEGERARALYDELLERPDLDARDYFLTGVGLYQVDEFEQAARAFDRTLDAVPGHRDALFNRVQSLFLAEMWEDLVEAGESLLQLDTHNRNAHQFLAQGLVRLGEEHEAVEVMEQMEALPFDVDDLQIQATGTGAILGGHVVNRHMPGGSEVQLRVHFYTVDGSEAGSTDVSVRLGEPEEAVPFQAEVQSDADVFGFRYEVLS
jgi:tetratricopeptide (TPR) repeat protein